MLAGATEFPNAGSYCLLLSPAPPASATASWGPHQQEEIRGPQLVRIIGRFIDQGGMDRFLISLPLRAGAAS
jgi:hypothetical protein